MSKQAKKTSTFFFWVRGPIDFQIMFFLTEFTFCHLFFIGQHVHWSIALVEVGGASEVEVGEVKDRLDDALCATRGWPRRQKSRFHRNASDLGGFLFFFIIVPLVFSFLFQTCKQLLYHFI